MLQIWFGTLPTTQTPLTPGGLFLYSSGAKRYFRSPLLAVSNFRIGEKIVYPTHGVGIIEQIHRWPSSDSPQKFYLLRIYSNSLRVMVPFSNATSVGLRRIVKAEEVERILQYLSAGLCSPAADWKCRYKENSERMKSGSLLQVAEVLKPGQGAVLPGTQNAGVGALPADQ